ncbi:MAG TPA: transglutaminase, partial [Arthrobacter bacterium]|nr:transglutaminase [Arthrobacter sp.]
SEAAIPLAWSELRDLGTDYGLPPLSSETPRTYSARLRRSVLLGGAGGMDEAAHQAVRTLTSDFERRHYGRPVPDAAGGATTEPVDSRITAVRESLRNNAPLPRRFRASWLPASVLGRWARFLAAPVKGIRRLALPAANAAAHSWSRARDGLFRPRGNQ